MSDSLLIIGAPASGKSRAAIDRFLATPDSLLLVPTSTMAEHVRHELARAGVAIRPSRVTTLARFIDTRAAAGIASSALLHLLIGEALDDLRPPRFREVAEYAGFRAA